MLEFVPDTQYQVLDGGHLALHEVHVEIEVAVIQLFDHPVFDDRTQVFRIHDEACVRTGYALDRDEKLEVVTVPVLVGALAENLVVLLFAPGRIVQFVCGVEMLDTRKINHGMGLF